MGTSIMQGRKTLLALGACLVACLSIAAEASAGPIVNFSAPLSATINLNANGVAVGDFNADGDPDLAVIADASANVSIRTGGAGGTFSAPTTFATGGGGSGIAIGEFNGDSDPDLAVATTSNGVGDPHGRGSGPRSRPPRNFPANSFSSDVTIAEFNGDSDPDLAVTNQSSDDVSILLGTGAGAATFGAPTNFTTGDRPFGVVAANFNGDAFMDLAVTNQGQFNTPGTNESVSILTGAAGPTFSAPTNITLGDGPDDIVTADFNTDGDPDLLVANGGSSTGTIGPLSLLLGSTGTTFAAPTTIDNRAPQGVAVADFNADSDLDVALLPAAANTVSILVGTTGTTFRPAQDFTASPGGSQVSSIATGNFDGGTLPDITTATYNPANSSSMLNTSDLVAPDTTVNSGPTGLTNDSTPTFTFSSNEGGPNFECRVLPGGTFAPCTSGHTTAAQGEGAHTFEVRAVDGGGNVDGTPATRSFTVDTVAPQTTVDSGPAGLTNDSTPTFGFSSSEGSSTFQCRVLRGSFAPCTSAHTTAAQGEGAHTFEVLATDAAGNTDASAATAASRSTPSLRRRRSTPGPQPLTIDSTPTFGFSSDRGRLELPVPGPPGRQRSRPCTSAAHHRVAQGDGRTHVRGRGGSRLPGPRPGGSFTHRHLSSTIRPRSPRSARSPWPATPRQPTRATVASPSHGHRRRGSPRPPGRRTTRPRRSRSPPTRAGRASSAACSRMAYSSHVRPRIPRPRFRMARTRSRFEPPTRWTTLTPPRRVAASRWTRPLRRRPSSRAPGHDG